MPRAICVSVNNYSTRPLVNNQRTVFNKTRDSGNVSSEEWARAHGKRGIKYGHTRNSSRRPGSGSGIAAQAHSLGYSCFQNICVEHSDVPSLGDDTPFIRYVGQKSSREATQYTRCLGRAKQVAKGHV